MQPLHQGVTRQKQNVDQDAGLPGGEFFFTALKTPDLLAFKALYKKYSPAVYGNIIRSVKEEEKAKLILEKTFCEAWQYFSQFDNTKLRIFTWINQFAVQNIKKYNL
ncbi:hypothetical protein GCM10007422_07860 [Pedobacter zeae]|uniref:RNA polymerase sigma-70 region 2 domain-containing protein n=1 Tax=Pedobacter zeae TaxID=1737356 RepID=A0A7W6P5I8_9SPHI|nr:hypothetical protein [Pedobacter zeae]GGG96459.1 hypothetical protein GCM10007422_07860 [Pedobacter zeae]